MKKLALMLAIALIVISLAPATAEGTVTVAARFRSALVDFENYLANGVEDELKLEELTDTFYRVGGKNGKFLGAYCDVLYYLSQGMYEFAVKCAVLICENESFAEFLSSELESNYIESGEILLTYAQARRAEDALDADTAFKLYGDCFTFFDANARKDSLLLNILDVKYNLGIEASVAGDYKAAYEYFVYTSGYDYKDSASLLKLAELEMNAEPEPCAHPDTYWTTVKAATCENAGLQSEICRICGSTLATAEIARTGHDYGSWSIYSDSYDRRECALCGAYEERAISYGAWSEWTLYEVEPSLGRRQVSTMFESETVYKYRKYHWYSETTKGWHNSPYDTSYMSSSKHGKWRYMESETPLDFAGEVSTEQGVWRMYEGYWYAYAAQSSPAVTTTTVYYRYRDRLN